MIRTIRQVLLCLLQTHPIKLDDDQLSTLGGYSPYIPLHRAITKMNDDANDLEALTPNHLLLFRPGPILPCGVFTNDDVYVRKRWCITWLTYFGFGGAKNTWLLFRNARSGCNHPLMSQKVMLF
jgi:hypothetical protein